MKRALLCLAVIGALVATSDADAQAGRKKLYRWVDKDGQVQFSDTLPPEAVDQARTEINSESGRTTAEVDRALTPEERALLEAQEREAAAAKLEADNIRQTEEAMISSFQTEEDLRRSFGERTSLLQQTLAAIEAAIAGQRASLSALLAQASEAELAGQPVMSKQAATILDLHREIGKQQQMLIVKQAELVALDKDLETLVLRFRELRGTTPAAPAATPPSTPPAG